MPQVSSPAPSWVSEYGTHTAVLGGRTYRIVAYPQGSPLAGKYGCYRGGKYTGLTRDLAAAKTWCSDLARQSRDSSSLP
ncbi:hypothetical protein FHP25_00940 [Vineibacter terrae]|uniref:Uncharacterized protein n=1 Tax=Vineibacter terrae TaxID=2586908 RepID=A0A5C8PW78_9HYPH|nr:hypothetical protein [Vineibacter terrae]TXL82295.1 hypothetical protein FHP25_00940 [Vineibacter terrae]